MVCEVIPEGKINWSVTKTVTGFLIPRSSLSAKIALRCQLKKKKGIFEIRSFEKEISLTHYDGHLFMFSLTCILF